jgi:ABC-2 type transport system permease protein
LVIRVGLSVLFISAGGRGVTCLGGWCASAGVVTGVPSYSSLPHSAPNTKGETPPRDLVFFASLLACFLFANAIILDAKKAD